MKCVSKWYRQIMSMPPRRKKILLVCLWCLAPIEMGVITGIFYLGKRLSQGASLSSTLPI
ncbi:MAG: hypothetical protein KGI25_06495 [Thaumarchaeota archaeon]|nr:hypothetical protein [Nitrososphaerota archaeon]